MDTPRRPLFFTLFGIYFACAGFAGLVAGAASLHFAGTLPALALAYAGLNFLLCRAFFLRQWWLLPALALNCGGFTLLYLAAWAHSGDISLIRFLLSTLLAGGALALAYLRRNSLVRNRGIYAGYAFLGLWILAFTYTASAVL